MKILHSNKDFLLCQQEAVHIKLNTVYINPGRTLNIHNQLFTYKCKISW